MSTKGMLAIPARWISVIGDNPYATTCKSFVHCSQSRPYLCAPQVVPLRLTTSHVSALHTVSSNAAFETVLGPAVGLAGILFKAGARFRCRRVLCVRSMMAIKPNSRERTSSSWSSVSGFSRSFPLKRDIPLLGFSRYSPTFSLRTLVMVQL